MVCKIENEILPIKYIEYDKIKNLPDKDYQAIMGIWIEKLKNKIEEFLAKFKTETIEATDELIRVNEVFFNIV